MADDAQHAADEPLYPQQPIHRAVRPIVRFMHVEAASGLVLLACTLAALVVANSPWDNEFLDFWKIHVTMSVGALEFDHSLKHLINDGLMAIFFFVVGLEVKRELAIGELREPSRAVLPVAAALGGMIAPAAIYLAFQSGEPGQRGWGIPMATDIAFVVGCLAVLGPRVPHSLRVLLLSLAIADDVGAILVIAIGYTEQVSFGWLTAGGLGIALVVLLARLGVRSFGVYTAAGVVIWYAFHESGIHATIAGVILGMLTPAGSYISTSLFGRVLRRADDIVHGDWDSAAHRAEMVRQFRHAARETISPLEYLESVMHPWVAFLIMPVFALANAGVPFEVGDLTAPVAVAVMAGLVLGKPAGILLVSWLAIAAGLARLPEGVTWRMLAGAGCLAGIGFTMALFIAGLALEGAILDTAKVGVLVGSVISAVGGMIVLGTSPAKAEPAPADAAQ